MTIGELVDSEIMQLYPISFAREMCEGVTRTMEIDTQSVKEPAPAPPRLHISFSSQQGPPGMYLFLYRRIIWALLLVLGIETAS